MLSCTRLRILQNTICRKPGFNSLRTPLNHGAEQASNETLKQTQQRNWSNVSQGGQTALKEHVAVLHYETANTTQPLRGEHRGTITDCKIAGATTWQRRSNHTFTTGYNAKGRHYGRTKTPACNAYKTSSVRPARGLVVSASAGRSESSTLGRVLPRPYKLVLQPSYREHGVRKSCREHTQNTKTNRVNTNERRNCTNSVLALQDHCSCKAPTTNHHIKQTRPFDALRKAKSQSVLLCFRQEVISQNMVETSLSPWLWESVCYANSFC